MYMPWTANCYDDREDDFWINEMGGLSREELRWSIDDEPISPLWHQGTAMPTMEESPFSYHHPFGVLSSNPIVGNRLESMSTTLPADDYLFQDEWTCPAPSEYLPGLFDFCSDDISGIKYPVSPMNSGVYGPALAETPQQVLEPPPLNSTVEKNNSVSGTPEMSAVQETSARAASIRRQKRKPDVSAETLTEAKQQKLELKRKKGIINAANCRQRKKQKMEYFELENERLVKENKKLRDYLREIVRRFGYS